MSTESQMNPPGPAGGPTAYRPEELPPVVPPSAGYIVQLFLIPALIVAALAAVVMLFGRLGDAETDWQQMVSELGSSNEHRRGRAAQGLAHLLWNDNLMRQEGDSPLAEEPLVADGLTKLLRESLQSKSPSDEEIRHQQYLARALGALRADDKVMPVLGMAMAPEFNAELRKSAVMSVAVIAGQHFDRLTGYSQAADRNRQTTQPAGKQTQAAPFDVPTITDAEVLKQLKLMAQDSDPVFRHLAAYALASVSGPDCIPQLKVMLLDSDAKTRANAAVGLARNNSPEGVSALKELLEESVAPRDSKPDPATSEQEQRLAALQNEVEQSTIARNCIKALSDLWNQLDSSQHTELLALLQKVAETHKALDVRMQAETAGKELASAAP